MTAPRIAPPTYVQQLMHDIDTLQPGTVFNPGFIMRGVFRMADDVDVETLRLALADVIARHSALRTVLVHDSEGLRQRVLPPMAARLVVDRLDRGVSLAEYVHDVTMRDYGWQEPPLLWAHVVRHSEGTALILVAHHIVCDAWSMRLLERDVNAAYAARREHRAPLGADVMQYWEIGADDHSAKVRARIEGALPYWRERLAGTAGLGLPVETRNPDTGPPVVHPFAVPDTLRDAVGKAARRARTTPFTLMLTAFASAVLPDGDAVVPVLTSGRPAVEWQTVGCLLNLLPIRIDDTADRDLAALVGRVDRACREAYAHDTALIHVLRAIPELLLALLSRDVLPPAFQMIPRMPLHDAVPDAGRLLRHVPDDVVPALPLTTPFLWSMRERDHLDGYVMYDSNLFSAAWMDRAVAAFLDRLAEIVR